MWCLLNFYFIYVISYPCPGYFFILVLTLFFKNTKKQRVLDVAGGIGNGKCQDSRRASQRGATPFCDLEMRMSSP